MVAFFDPVADLFNITLHTMLVNKLNIYSGTYTCVCNDFKQTVEPLHFVLALNYQSLQPIK